MGRNKTYYLHDDVLELLGDAGGNLINNLIREHFSKDEETLKRRLEEVSQEHDQILAKLNLKIEHRMKIENARLQKQALSDEEQARASQLSGWKADWEDKRITDEQYFKAFGKDGKYNQALADKA